MRYLKVFIISIFILIGSFITAQAVSITGPIRDNGPLDKETTWYQEVQANNTGAVNFTIYLYDWNNLPEPEYLTAEIFNTEMSFEETVWYSDVGSQSLTFTWNDQFLVNKDEWYTFSITGSDDIPNRILNFTYNVYEGDLYSNKKDLYDNNGYTYTSNYDLIFDNRISSNPVPEPTTLLLFGLGLIGVSAVGRSKRKL